MFTTSIIDVPFFYWRVLLLRICEPNTGKNYVWRANGNVSAKAVAGGQWQWPRPRAAVGKNAVSQCAQNNHLFACSSSIFSCFTTRPFGRPQPVP